MGVLGVGFLAVSLAACAEGRSEGQLGLVEGFAGLIAADEPQAVLIGRDVLGNGGTAIDAAVAMYFTMTVSLPARVGLGGGGLCVLFDGDEGSGEAIEFLPRAAPSGGIVPAGVRGIAAMHARHGVVRWERLVSPAENLARFGLRVSRAFRNDLEAGRDVIFANETLRRIYTRDGELPQVGDQIVQAELSGVLAGVRQQGAAYVHAGPLTARLAEASSAVGMPLSSEDIRNSLPELRPTVEIAIGDDVAYFAPPRSNGGVVAAQIWKVAEEIGDYSDLDGADAAHVFAEASARAFGDRARWQAADGSARVAAASLVDDERARGLMA
ncbi:MAG: gamma-glutamyltransferase, partial [Kiloniellales bacterium]